MTHIERNMKIPEDKEFDQLVANIRKVAKDEDEMIKLLEQEVVIRFFNCSFHENSNKREKLSIEEPSNSSSSSSTLGNKQKFSASKKARLLKEKPLKKPSVSGEKRPNLIGQHYCAQNSNHKKFPIKEQSVNTTAALELASKKARLLKEKSLKKPIFTFRKKTPNLIQQQHCWHPQPELPMEIKNVIEQLGGSEAKLVIEKKLFKTDMHPHHDRLSIPKNQVRVEFLEEEEKNEIENKDGIKVRVIEPYLGETMLSFREWNLKSSTSYVLNSGWKYVAERAENQLNVKDKVQVWSFRVHGELRFAVVKLPQGNPEGGQNSNDSQTKEEEEEEEEEEAGPSTSPCSGRVAPK